jgi:DeoR/GlpR family transcriptional regulator of sugar metabolism
VTERQQLILDRLDTASAVSYDGLAELFGVSEMTIRRDVGCLVNCGAVIKTLGGVQRAATETGNLHETALLSRLANQRQEKRAIARLALGLLDTGQTVFMDGSSTCLELAKLAAREARGLTVVTNSIMICRDLGQNSNNSVVGLGGQYDPTSLSFLGAACEDEVRAFFPDVAVFSTKGFIPAEGTYESFLPTLHIKQLVARQSRRVVLLVDHTKFGQRALRKVLEIGRIHDVITDAAAPAADLALLRKRGRRVWVAPHAQPGASVAEAGDPPETQGQARGVQERGKGGPAASRAVRKLSERRSHAAGPARQRN